MIKKRHLCHNWPLFFTKPRSKILLTFISKGKYGSNISWHIIEHCPEKKEREKHTDQLKICSWYFKRSLGFKNTSILSIILSYLFAVLYNVLIRHEYKFCLSCRGAGVTPEVLKGVGREGGGGWMRRREAGTDRPWNHSWKNFFNIIFLGYVSNVAI